MKELKLNNKITVEYNGFARKEVPFQSGYVTYFYNNQKMVGFYAVISGTQIFNFIDEDNKKVKVFGALRINRKKRTFTFKPA